MNLSRVFCKHQNYRIVVIMEESFSLFESISLFSFKHIFNMCVFNSNRYVSCATGFLYVVLIISISFYFRTFLGVSSVLQCCVY